ncbi:NAD(P)-dependent dehydrogenase (short-subunit alcohol dehydrogenase family) [Rhizomicrobium palustre]|uniref:NAD(P)-dependent dehydrogenase (Short-subunit alcohol dehydrogenase family) n=1 Tax=Rhizomicrobium palustre TaxID=189966 RepID=A0A846MUT5_9PROT|nr:SDR family oxidoreductase [Rhizomicrobium palustre]NIK86989.1 NAD(P)-dependent dehydrogenase (short-subunit alcohol dehydrogenase family) [Rhizomicrobium palustre]
MNGKTVVITGGTSGIGEVAAIRLSEMGAKLVLVAREESRALATLAKLKGEGHSYHLADLSSLASVKHLASEIRSAHESIDVLINNAGGYFDTRQVTVDGLERTFAVNHMAYFVLTAGLFLNFKPGARIISTASDAHRMAKIDWDDLQSTTAYKGFTVYSNTKLMNILFTLELAKKLEGLGVAAFALHPGFVNTRFADNNDSGFAKFFQFLKKWIAITPEEGAKTIVHLVTTPGIENLSGSYWAKCKPSKPRKAAQNEADAKRLWEISERIAHG